MPFTSYLFLGLSTSSKVSNCIKCTKIYINTQLVRKNILLYLEYTLENTEGQIKNGQFRDTGDIGPKRHMTKTNKALHKTKKDEQNGPRRKSGVNPGARERHTVPSSYNTPAMLLVKSKDGANKHK